MQHAKDKEPSLSLSERIRTKIAALKERGPKPRDLGTGAAANAAQKPPSTPTTTSI